MNIFKFHTYRFIVFVFLLLSFSTIKAQSKYDQMAANLELLAKEVPALNEKVNISVARVSIQEFLRGIANNTGLNIDVDPSINISLVNNFSDVIVRDILVYICRQYNLELRITGNIFNIYKNPSSDILPRVNPLKFDTLGLITLDYKDEYLNMVVKDIAAKTGKNLVLSPSVADKKVSGYILSMPFENALEKFMFSNSLKVNKTNDNFYIIEPVANDQQIDNQRENQDPRRKSNSTKRENSNTNAEGSFEIKLLGTDSLLVMAEAASVTDLIFDAATKSNSNYYLATKIEDKVSLKLKKASFETLLQFVLSGTKYSYKKLNGIYIIGEDRSFQIKQNAVVKLRKRNTDKLLELIPKDIKEGLEIIEFPELNSFFVSGPQRNIDVFAGFIEKIDQPVPVVLIEVIILEINDNISLKTGIDAGLGKEKVKSSGTVFPGFDVTLGSEAINKFLKTNKHFGLENLGNVAPNFYVTLSAMESQGLVNIRSTPQLSTLNGHEATMSIGTTEYYVEEQSNLIGTQNPVSNIIKTYKPLNAELAITIKPFISGDDQITMEIEVKQSDFTTRITQTAPPASVSRNFKSQIRIKNQEMVLLGGLEQKKASETGSGVPFLSRIPVIKWLFSSRLKENNKSKMNVFIRPTIVN